jgi:Cu(I)/Ag(I) efflux system membrane fusion protein
MTTWPSSARSIWLLALMGALLGALAVSLLPASLLFTTAAEHRELMAEAGVRYICPMLDYVGRHPGRCPVCGMILQRVEAGDFNQEQLARMGLQVSTITSGPAQVLIRGYGTVVYDERTARVVIPRVSGRVVRRYPATLHDDVAVEVGDPLIDIYSPELFAAQLELQSAIQLKQRTVIDALTDRFNRLNLAGVARAIADGGKPADTVTLVSPFAGHVHRMMRDGQREQGQPQIGATIQADQPLITLLDHDSLVVSIHVPEVYSRFLRTGLEVSLASDDAGELPEIKAQVDWLAPDINIEIRARELHLHLQDSEHRLLAGALVQARIHATLAADLTAADPRAPETWGTFILVPKSAVLSTGVRQVVWKQVRPASAEHPARFILVQLALGPRLEDEHGADRYVVRSGLQAGDVVATQGAFLIDSQAQLTGSASLLFPDGAARAADAPEGR